MNNLPGRWPGEVESYDGPSRTCRVRIPGITDGSSELPVAVFETPLGDRAQGDHPTEIRILPGDLVWLCFECGDPRFPIITGFRTARQGNPVDWRRWRHANIEMTADGKFIVNADEYIVNANKATINAATTEVNAETATVNSPVTQVNGGLGITAAANGGDGKVTMAGNIESTGTLKNNGVNVGSSHVHADPQGSNTGTPI